MQRVQLTRRGFTLIELLVALVLLGIVSLALYRVLVNNQRVYMAQTQRIDLSQNIRAATTILPAELRELSASEGDIGAMTATRLDIRAMRWLGFICTPPVLGGALTGASMVIRGGAPSTPMFYGRAMQLTDSMLIYYDGNQTTRSDDFWALGKPTSTPSSQACLDGRPGQRLIHDLFLLGVPGANRVGAITVGAPVRGYERVIYELWQSPTDGLWYIGLQPAGQTMQPLIGPLLPNGLTFTYFDSTGAVTANRFRVARIDITVRARSVAGVRASGDGPIQPIVDSVVTSVALRNNRRF